MITTCNGHVLTGGPISIACAVLVLLYGFAMLYRCSVLDQPPSCERHAPGLTTWGYVPALLSLIWLQCLVWFTLWILPHAIDKGDKTAQRSSTTSMSATAANGAAAEGERAERGDMAATATGSPAAKQTPSHRRGQGSTGPPASPGMATMANLMKQSAPAPGTGHRRGHGSAPLPWPHGRGPGTSAAASSGVAGHVAGAGVGDATEDARQPQGGSPPGTGAIGGSIGSSVGGSIGGAIGGGAYTRLDEGPNDYLEDEEQATPRRSGGEAGRSIGVGAAINSGQIPALIRERSDSLRVRRAAIEPVMASPG